MDAHTHREIHTGNTLFVFQFRLYGLHTKIVNEDTHPKGLIVREHAAAQRKIPSSDSRDKPQRTAWREVAREQRLMGIRKEESSH